MKLEPLSLINFEGGLNDRDPASALSVNECARLENYFTDGKGLLEKRPGQEIIQFTPINPQVFVNDANTVALWHLDEAAEPFSDSSSGGISLEEAGSLSPLIPTPARATLQSTGIFSGDRIFRGSAQVPLLNKLNGTLLGYFDTVAFPNQIEGGTACTFEGWVNPSPAFNGSPLVLNPGPPASATYFSNAAQGIGVPLIGTANFDSQLELPSNISNGLTLHRDWDFVNNKNASDIYVKFRIQTKIGTGFQVTETSGGKIPTGKWTHIRGTYNALTGYVRIFVNGTKVAEALTSGAIHDPGPSTIPLDGYGYVIGGLHAVSINRTTGAPSSTILLGVVSAFTGQIDEVRISNIDRGLTGFPFDSGRGMGFEFSKSDGTRLAVISANDKLWYTIGDGAWTQMKFYDNSVPSFSVTAYWDAIFRNDILYLGNGVDNPLAFDGATLTDWMAPKVAPTLSLSATIATITAGTHKVAFTYLYGSYETGLSPIASIDNAAGEQINVSDIPPRHSNCTGVRIYMSKNGASDLYLAREIPHTPGASMSISGAYIAGSPAGYSTDSGALGPADGSLGGSGYPAIASWVATAVSPNPKFLLAEHDRAFVCGMENERYTLRWSELGAFDVFSVFSFANATSNQGNLIALASYYGEVHCSKDGRATLILTGSNPQNWRVLETLHPDVGAIDHWSYVRRYPVGSDRYILCFKGRDGFYRYAGQEIECISDKIRGTIERLTSNNGTRDEWSVTTQAQWQAQLLSAGTATVNMVAPRYESDGLREIPGTAKIIDQLDYLGLWPSAFPLVAGNVISVEKGVNEGEFYFATDAATTLYWTPDNFQTVQPIGTTLTASERIIQIVKQGTADTYFLFTDSAGTGQSSGGGNLYSVADPTGSGGFGPVFQTLTTSVLYYDLDVPVYMTASSFPAGAIIGHDSSNNSGSIAPNNIFINHQQTIGLSSPITSGYAFGMQIGDCPTITGAATSVTSVSGGLPIPTSVTLATGFHSIRVDLVGYPGSFIFAVGYTRRQFPRWRGGTHSPQPYWDATNSRLVFLASTVEDSGGNRSSYLRTWDSTNGVVNQYTAENVASFGTDGTNILFETVVQNTSVLFGFAGRLRKSTLAAPGTVTSTANTVANTLISRLSYNSQSTNWMALVKTFNSGVQEFWTYRSELQSLVYSTAAMTNILSLAANGDSGTYFTEIALQTGLPYRWYVAASALSTANPASVYVVQPTATATVSSYKADAYEGEGATAAVTGILSNLLFVSSSGTSGNNLWADRLYWWGSAAAASNARMIQLGVPGQWRVVGVFESEAHNLGSFSAFDNLASGFDNHGNVNGVIFEDRNAVDAATLPTTSYLPQAPNDKILGFTPVQPYFQWRITLAWDYDAAASTVTDSPTVEFVNVGFFLGNANLPRTIGFQWEGRTFWTCSEDASPTNNVVIVYQKNGGWMKIYGWPLSCMFRFRNQMVGLQEYQLVRLMTGRSDAGALIRGKARTGAILGFFDKIVARVQANVLAWANSLFSSASGYVKITPYQEADSIPDAAWVIELAQGTEKAPVRVLGVPDDEFAYEWVRALSLEIGTSEDVSGNWVPVTDQAENIQQIDLVIERTDDAYDLVVR